MGFWENQGENDARYGRVDRNRANIDPDYARGVARVPGAATKEYTNIGFEAGQSIGKAFEGNASAPRESSGSSYIESGAGSDKGFQVRLGLGCLAVGGLLTWMFVDTPNPLIFVGLFLLFIGGGLIVGLILWE